MINEASEQWLEIHEDWLTEIRHKIGETSPMESQEIVSTLKHLIKANIHSQDYAKRYLAEGLSALLGAYQALSVREEMKDVLPQEPTTNK